MFKYVVLKSAAQVPVDVTSLKPTYSEQEGALPHVKLCPTVSANPGIALSALEKGERSRADESPVSEWVGDGKGSPVRRRTGE